MFEWVLNTPLKPFLLPFHFSFLKNISSRSYFCILSSIYIAIPAGIYLLKVNNRDTRARYKIFSKLIIKIPEQPHWRRSGIFIVNFGHICSSVSIVNFEHVIAGWDYIYCQEKTSHEIQSKLTFFLNPLNISESPFQ